MILVEKNVEWRLCCAQFRLPTVNVEGLFSPEIAAEAVFCYFSASLSSFNLGYHRIYT